MRKAAARTAAGLVLLALLLAGPAETAEDRARLRAEFEAQLVRLRAEHQRKLAETRLELDALEAKSAVLRPLTPAAFDGDPILQLIQSLTAGSSDTFGGLDAKVATGSEKILAPDGGTSPFERFHVDVTGRAPYFGLATFLERLSHVPRIVELERLEVEAAPGAEARIAMRLGFPCRTGWPPSATAVGVAVPPAIGAYATVDEERRAYELWLAAHGKFFDAVVEAAREPIRRIQAQIATLERLRNERPPGWAVIALATVGKETGEHVMLSRARLGDEVVLEGVAVGVPARAGLKSALERAGLAVHRLDIESSGECRRFTASARRPERRWLTETGTDDPGRRLFDHRIAEVCTPAASSPLAVAVKGSAGELDVRLRDVDVVDVFRVLHELTPASFVVDDDAEGRLNVDFERATLEQALEAMAGTGLAISEGPLRRVSRRGAAPSPSRAIPGSGEPVSLSFKDGDLIDVLRLFADISEREVWTAPVLDAGVNIFCRDLPWDQVLSSIAATAGMVTVIEKERMFVGPPALARAPWTSAVALAGGKVTSPRTSVPSWLALRGLVKLGAEDLKVAGLVRSEGRWSAYAYGPGRTFWSLAPGTELYDARVESIGPTGAAFKTEDGRRVELTLAP